MKRTLEFMSGHSQHATKLAFQKNNDYCKGQKILTSLGPWQGAPTEGLILKSDSCAYHLPNLSGFAHCTHSNRFYFSNKESIEVLDLQTQKVNTFWVSPCPILSFAVGCGYLAVVYSKHKVDVIKIATEQCHTVSSFVLEIERVDVYSDKEHTYLYVRNKDQCAAIAEIIQDEDMSFRIECCFFYPDSVPNELICFGESIQMILCEDDAKQYKEIKIVKRNDWRCIQSIKFSEGKRDIQGMAFVKNNFYVMIQNFLLNFVIWSRKEFCEGGVLSWDTVPKECGASIRELVLVLKHDAYGVPKDIRVAIVFSCLRKWPIQFL